MDRPFLHAAFDEGSQLINLNQIVRALLATDDSGEDELEIYMSDGYVFHIHGDGAMKLLKLLSHYTINYEGKPWELTMRDDQPLNQSAEPPHE